MTTVTLPLAVPLGQTITATSRRSIATKLLPSLAAALFLGLLRIAIAFGSRLMSGDGDPARHLLVGQYILKTGTLPTTNLFIHSTPDQPFLPHEWLAEIATALSHRAFGLAGPVLLYGAVAALAFSLVFSHLRRRGTPLLLAAGLTLVAVNTALVHFQMRPHVFSFLGLAVFHLVLERFHRAELSARRLLWLVPAIALWANLHGAFALGIVLVLTYLCADVVRLFAQDPAVRGSARRRLPSLATVTAVGFAATLVNPRGAGLILSLSDYAGGSLVTRITEEFQSPDFNQLYGRLFLALLLGLITLLALSPRRASVHDVALAAGFTYLALTAGRNIALFAIAVTPILGPPAAALCVLFAERVARVPSLASAASWIARRNAVYTRIDAAANHFILPAAALVLTCILAAAQHAAGETPLGVTFDPSRQPVEASTVAERSALRGEVFNKQSWGGYLELRWWPYRKPFIDGELNAHSDQLLKDYLAVANVEPGWEDVLRKYHVRSVLFESDSPLVRTLAARPDWEVVHRDDLATVVVASNEWQ